MNNLVLPVIEENDNETEKRKIGETIITMPEQEQIEDLRAECAKSTAGCIKTGKNLFYSIKLTIYYYIQL